MQASDAMPAQSERVAFAIWHGQLDKPCADVTVMIDEPAKATEPRSQDSQRKLLYFRYSLFLASGSYTRSFVIVSRTVAVFLSIESQVPRSLWQANDAISPEQNVFSEVDMIQIFKSLRGTLEECALQAHVYA